MTEQPSLSFAGLVRQLRKEVKLTQEELAEAAGLSPRAVSDLERGINRTAHKNTAVQLAAALGLADPVSVVFVAAARGRAPASHVLTALGTAGQKPGRVGPRLWNIPARNLTFTGRDDLLAAVRERLLAGHATVVQALHGMGGVGKTQLASEYAHRWAGSYELAWWIDAEQGGLIADQVADLGQALGCVPAGAESEAVRAAVLAELRHRGRWLLIFDNAEAPADVAPWLPGDGGHVLITSRKHGWDEIAAPVEVEVFTRAESVELLGRRIPGLALAEAGRLAQELGDLPLAIAQAAGFMADTGTPLPQYLDMLRNQAGQLLAQGAPGSYPQSLAAATAVIAARLSDQDPAAAELANLCAFLAPEPIPDDLFTRAASLLPGELAVRAADPLAWRQTLASIAGQSLARLDQRGLQMHRLTQAILRDRLTPACVSATREHTEAILAASDPGEPPDPATWARWAQLTPHVLAADLAATDNHALRNLVRRVCWYLIERGDARTPRALMSELHRQWRARLGQDHEDTLMAAHYLAWSLLELGRYDEARVLNRDTWERRRRVLGEGHPDTLNSAHNLALVLRLLGDLRAARDLNQDTWQRHREAQGPDHRSTLRTAHILAADLRELGDAAAAHDLDRDTLERRQRVLGEDHPDTLNSAYNLAADLRDLGDVQAARDLDRDTLERRQRLLGEDHPDALESAHNLAADLRELGELTAARDLDRDTLERRRRVLGQDHPDTLSSARNLAADLRGTRETDRGLRIPVRLREQLPGGAGRLDRVAQPAAAGLAQRLRGAPGPERGQLPVRPVQHLRARPPRYIPGTMVLETTWHTASGWLVVNDFFVVRPVADQGRRAGYERVPRVGAGVGTILRTATCISGKVEVAAMCLPMFGYGSTPSTWSYDGDSYHSLAVREPDGDIALSLHSSLQLGHVAGRAYARTALNEGQSGFIALTWSGPPPTAQQEADADLESTVRFWREWLSTGRFPDHPWRPYIERSALTLKGLSYAPTGAIMAASTTSLPETPGGARNWDYRFTWIRDSGFTLRALHRLGYEWEALEYFAFILGAVRGKDSANPFNELQIMYGIGGERDLSEKTIDQLAGWRDSKPVRVGNGAWNQHQNDVWGMLLYAVDAQLRRGAEQIIPPVWEGIAGFVDQAITHAGDPDQGIREIRGGPQHFTASAVMCWVAAARGADLARGRGDAERAAQWQQAADEMKAEILDKGVDERGRFRQAYENDDLDASLLLIPIMGFLPPDDDRVKATVLAIADELTEDGLVLRYKVDTTDTGFAGKEGTFTICSWWLVTTLAMIGETDRARALCKKLLSYAGPLNLYAEEIDASTGEHLGNFPQAFTHLALIEAVSQLIEEEARHKALSA